MTEPLLIPSISLPVRPPDWSERSRALDPERSFLVQAPAGSGKTYLLTQRFLRLLGRAEKPDEIVAITFTNAAAAEMRNRILEELERAELAGADAAGGGDPESLGVLAWQALERGRQLGWELLDQPGQLRITTIDAFCRGLALQSPLSWGGLTELGGRLDPVTHPEELYRRAAKRTLELLHQAKHPVRESVESLLLWRDNYWKDVEDLLVRMLQDRNRWFKEFVFLQGSATEADWLRLRARLEEPFRRAARGRLEVLCRMLDGLAECRECALGLARFAYANGGCIAAQRFVERDGLPGRFDLHEAAALEDALEAYGDLAQFLLIAAGTWRKKGGLNVSHGFPPTTEGKAAKERFSEFVAGLDEEPGLEAALAAFLKPMPTGYSEEEWELIRHCFAVMRVAAGELQVVFAEAGSVDFTEVARIALDSLAPVDGYPTEFALRVADGIRHLLVDEFQDTSRNQHELLARLVGAWGEREGRSVFCVGDPMQSIYGFREAEVELFERLKTYGLEAGEAFPLEFVSLTANFRTEPSLVNDLNGRFTQIFAEDDGSGVRFAPAIAARASLRPWSESGSAAKAELHLAFTRRGAADGGPGDGETTRREQLAEMVELIRDRLDAGRAAGMVRCRVAVLGRTKRSLMLVAEALREAEIRFRAIDLVPLRERPEVLDALSLIRALLNPVDRTAWLGVLRAPWCGLSLAELHLLTSADDTEVMRTPVPELLLGRLVALFADGQLSARAYEAANRVGHFLREAGNLRTEGATAALGTWVESVWKALGGEATADMEERENLRLLWRSLDALPEGEVDLLGAGLDAALQTLCALPDPAASAEFGVQLMTIHRSKGLEFEVVIVPDLEAQSRGNDPALLSWLERGLAGDVDGSGELTELLIAPIQTKGSDAGAAKKWVDKVRRGRETQELRRLLYVAATRAREELHLFARPRFTEKKGELGLAKAAGLLATAWPAVGDEVEGAFADWVAAVGGGVVEEIAAGAVLEMPGASGRGTLVRRLPEGFVGPGLTLPGGVAGGVAGAVAGGVASEIETEPLYARTEGGLESRLRGTAIHALLERLSRLRLQMQMAEALVALREGLPGIVAEVRGKGLAAEAARKLAADALTVVERVAGDAVGDWVLAPHQKAETEARWTGMVRGEDGREQLANLQPDRVFFAAGPQSESESEAESWWILDYKSSYGAGLDVSDAAALEAFLLERRAQYRGQLGLYAQVLRGMVGDDGAVVRAGIYYPRLRVLDWWLA